MTLIALGLLSVMYRSVRDSVAGKVHGVTSTVVTTLHQVHERET
jgi:hypothetical protein